MIDRKPSIEEKAILKTFTQTLKNRGFFKLDNSASNYTQLFNNHTQKTYPLSFLNSEFSSYLKRNSLKCAYREPSYIIYSLENIVGSKFAPNKPSLYVEPISELKYANTWQPYTYSAVKVELSPLFLEFLERLFPVPTERHTITQWLAHIFQRPEQRPSWHLLLSSDTGTGKGVLFNNILHPLLKHASVVNSYSKVMGTFSTILEDNLLVLLDDPKSKSDSTQTKLKSLLSEELAYVERKGLQGGMVRTYSRFILASNEVRPLFLEANERRWFCAKPLVHKVDTIETQSFIKRLIDWLEQEGSLDAVHRYFMTYNLEGFNPKQVEQTASLQEMIGMSTNPHATFLGEFIESHKVFDYTMLKKAFTEECLSKPSDQQMPHLLREHGYKKFRITMHSRRVFVYAKENSNTETIISDYDEVLGRHVF
jgi:hypothetical protein